MNELIKQLVTLNQQLNTIQTQIDLVKDAIEKDLPENGYKDESVTIVRKASSSTTSIDLKKLEQTEPELYADLLKDYTKTSVRKESVSYLFKKV